jgi:NAD(P)H-dependent FMN reductase
MSTVSEKADGRVRVLTDGDQIPLLGLGVWQVPNATECVNAVRWALELEYRHIDAAQIYGNEESVGRALRESGLPRDEVFVTTKFDPARPVPTAEAERSLGRLGVDYWPLPMFAETVATVGDFGDPTYSEPIVRRWNQAIAAGDAFIFITPEYNHSFSGVLKNAIDNVFVSWGLRNKPAAFVGYSGGMVGGARAVEQLALVTIEAEMVPLRNSVLVGTVQSAFDGTGRPTNPQSDVALAILLEDLAWWTDATVAARAAGELKPGSLRFRALAAAS